MIGERIIREALTPETRGPVAVRAHVRNKPANPKREAIHQALRRAVALSSLDRSLKGNSHADR